MTKFSNKSISRANPPIPLVMEQFTCTMGGDGQQWETERYAMILEGAIVGLYIKPDHQITEMKFDSWDEFCDYVSLS